MIVDNPLAHYYSQVQVGLNTLASQASITGRTFNPGPKLPELTPTVRNYLSSFQISFQSLGSYQGFDLSLADLTRTPTTNTTKTLPSLVIAARAVAHIRSTGEKITIISPSSGNKVTALRDAVLRAITTGLVTPDELNIVSIVPLTSLHKLRVSELLLDTELCRRNPIAVYDGADPEAVKALAMRMVDDNPLSIESEIGARLWYTLVLDNYLAGDVVRAFAEADSWRPPADRARLHVQSVSSAYGLLGHAFGRELLGDRAPGLPSRYFLVQHLGAPDMVTSLYRSSSPDWVAPRYVRQEDTGCFTQGTNPHFPAVAFDPHEVLDTTFYTHHPVTSERINPIIRAHGGGGIVLSFAECMQRYGQVRALLRNAEIHLPINPASICEWSLIMATTGILNAIDRGLVHDGEDILIHGAGFYTRNDYEPPSQRATHPIENSEQLRELVLGTRAISRPPRPGNHMLARHDDGATSPWQPARTSRGKT